MGGCNSCLLLNKKNELSLQSSIAIEIADVTLKISEKPEIQNSEENPKLKDEKNDELFADTSSLINHLISQPLKVDCNPITMNSDKDNSNIHDQSFGESKNILPDPVNIGSNVDIKSVLLYISIRKSIFAEVFLIILRREMSLWIQFPIIHSKNQFSMKDYLIVNIVQAQILKAKKTKYRI